MILVAAVRIRSKNYTNNKLIWYRALEQYYIHRWYMASRYLSIMYDKQDSSL